MPLRQQQQALGGTGFVVTGNLVATNSHTVPEKVDAERREILAVFVPLADERAEVRPARVLARDQTHDLCLLRFEGPPLPRLRLAPDEGVREGQAIAFTGFPILQALGLHPATHQGIISAITPVVIPVGSSREINRALVTRLERPFDVYQLDAVAYPGNSGSPVYDPDSGRVLAVINSTFVKETKETAITAPSGISYAIPARHLRALLAGAGVKE
jgi:serine protease Do